MITVKTPKIPKSKHMLTTSKEKINVTAYSR